jgi:hypothetical protein
MQNLPRFALSAVGLLLLVSQHNWVKGSGATVVFSGDSSGATDVTALLRTNVSAAGSGGTLIIPAGKYKVTASLNGGCGTYAVQLPAGITIQPQGAVRFVNSAGRTTSGNNTFVFQTKSNSVHITNGVDQTSTVTYPGDPRNPDGSGSGTFESDGIGALCGYFDGNAGHLGKDLQLTGWYAHDVYTATPHGLQVTGIVDGLRVDHNWYFNICKNGCQNTTYWQIYDPPNCNPRKDSTGRITGWPECAWSGVAMEFQGGIANAKIQWNKIDWTGNDGMHAWWDEAVNKATQYKCDNVYVTNNVFDRVQRMSIEMQAASNYYSGCCNSLSPGTNFQLTGNWDRTHWYPTTTGWWASVNNDYKNQLIANNSATYGTRSSNNNIPMYTPYVGLESNIAGGTEQGNVWSVDQQSFSVIDPQGYRTGTYSHNISNYQAEGPAGSQYTINITNNSLCGTSKNLDGHTLTDNDGHTQNSEWITADGGSGKYPRLNFDSNFQSGTCPGAGSIEQPNIVAGFTNDVASLTTDHRRRLEKMYVISNLSIDKVGFSVDRPDAPIADDQRLQDINPNFGKDRKWMYHVNLNLNRLSPGPHMLIAKATDVSGHSETITKGFSGVNLLGEPSLGSGLD